MGDPCGIGPEIVLKALATQPAHRPCVVIGDRALIQRLARQWSLPVPAAIIQPGPDLPEDLPIGQVDARAADAAVRYVLHATQLARAGTVRAIVTAPLSKEAISKAGHPYPGHTELLAHSCGDVPVRMMLANDELRTVLVSIHVSLREAIDRVRTDLILQTLILTHQALIRAGIRTPRLAVAGLNPHAGESGLFGTEEIEQIAPAIRQAKALGIDATGPWPPDTVFMRARGFRLADAVIAMYHDQGLIPVKYLGVETGVNITIGLPFVRTSPDHGTAFDIAGRGLADPSSMKAAIEQAFGLSQP
jgi:4-hydroxythreonine-4-phosphate dehydrogenase